jgi:3-isopropylmalate dehydratase small subunit
MTTEMGGIISLFPPNDEVLSYCHEVCNRKIHPVYADNDAEYAKTLTIDIENLEPLISKPGHPEDVIPVQEVQGRKIDSAFIGSCTNGRYEDLLQAAHTLSERKIAPGVLLKIVPSTDRIWQRALKDGLISLFKEAGALVGNAGCAGCAEGQIGQNGPGEVTVSTGNRNFAGKQGQGEVYLASPATVVASAVAGHITSIDNIPDTPSFFQISQEKAKEEVHPHEHVPKPTKIRGRIWIIEKDNVDTDMIYHNRYLTVTDLKEMAQYAFSNLEDWQDFPKKAQPGDILIISGENFGCGSSRQQAVDSFRALGISLIIAKSFGAIYERNAINSGFPLMIAQDIQKLSLSNGEEIEADLMNGQITKILTNETIQATPFSKVQLEIYQRGGLLE